MNREFRMDSCLERRGQSLVEMAFVLPVILVLGTALMEYTWMYYHIAAVQFATHEGARYGAVGRTNDEVADKVRKSMFGMSVTTIEIEVNTSGGSQLTSTDRTVGNVLTVRGKIAYSYLTPLLQFVKGSRIDELRGKSVVTIESSVAR